MAAAYPALRTLVIDLVPTAIAFKYRQGQVWIDSTDSVAIRRVPDIQSSGSHCQALRRRCRARERKRLRCCSGQRHGVRLH